MDEAYFCIIYVHVKWVKVYTANGNRHCVAGGYIYM